MNHVNAPPLARAIRRTALFAALAAASAPALAITFGSDDGTNHPNVGSLVVSIPGEGVFQWCSGTLIAPTVFLTASHCTQPIDGFVAANPGSQFLVTFDPVIDAGGTFYTGTAHTNPLYASGGNSDPHDVAVFVLDSAPPITPASLPAPGLLDALKDQHALSSTTFTAVGYGTVRDSMQKGWQGILDNDARQYVDQQFSSLTAAWIDLAMHPTGANGGGGTCYGDSGGPHFVWLDGVETDIVAAITITGDAQCKALDKDYRIDTAETLAFLAPFLAQP